MLCSSKYAKVNSSYIDWLRLQLPRDSYALPGSAFLHKSFNQAQRGILRSVFLALYLTALVLMHYPLGLCLLIDKEVTCVSSAFGSNDSTLSRLRNASSNNSIPNEATNLVITATHLQSQVLLNTITFAAAFFLSGMVLELFHTYSIKRSRQQGITAAINRRINFFRQASLACVWAASALTLAAALAILQAVRALNIVSQNGMVLGILSIVLHYLSFGFSFILAVGSTMFNRGRSSAMSGQSSSSGSGFGEVGDNSMGMEMGMYKPADSSGGIVAF